MYYIKQSDWERIPNDYKGKSIEDKTTKVVFEGAIPENKGKGGTTLLFEHQHFEIISDVYEMKISKGLQVETDIDDLSREDDTYFPMWGTMWSFGDSKERGVIIGNRRQIRKIDGYRLCQ